MDSLIAERIVQFTHPDLRIGATYVTGEGTYVRLWAPKAKKAFIEWENEGVFPLQREGNGYYTGHFHDKADGSRYCFILDKKPPIPDPASRFQPEGIFGRSEVVSSDYAWGPEQAIAPFSQWVIYEIHTGAFSESHDFAGIIRDLPRLKTLGIKAIEIMPVSQFPGGRNWGYDGVFPHAVQDSYGGPLGLKALVDACHRQGLAVILDVVCNHLGPEGNVLYECGPYAQEKYHTPWGAALNFDGPDSEEVRRYFLQSIWQWLMEYRIDGLRLDAVQMIYDSSPIPFLEEVSRLKAEAEKLRDRPLFLIAETDMNDSRLLQPLSQNGMGFDAQWADDLHHNLHVLLTGEERGYYADYGSLEQLARIYRDGVAFTGQYSPYRRRRHGRSYAGIDKKSLIVELQNHDQVGNRMLGDRLSTQIGFEKMKLGAACVLLSPFTPFLFMGEEFFCQTPFLFFVNYSDNKLIDAMRSSRKKEWKDFCWDQEPLNPADIKTFEKCILPDRNFSPNSREAIMTAYYTKLISLSGEFRMMVLQQSFRHEECVILQYSGEDDVLVILSFETDHKTYRLSPSREWEILLKSESFPVETEGGADSEIGIPPFSANVIRGKKDAISPQHMPALPLLSTATGEPVAGGD